MILDRLVTSLFNNFIHKTFISLLGVFLTSFALGQDLIIPEPALQSAIARSLGVSEKSLTKELVASKLIRLQANDLGIRELTGLEHAQNLESLVLRDNLIDRLLPIQNLKNLKNLDLSGNRLTDVSDFASFQSSSLRLLNLSRNRLLGLSGLSGLSALAQLDVSNNSLIDLEGISDLKGLVNLYAQGNQLGRVESFADRNRNKEFDEGETFTDESGNGKRDTDPLVELSNLPKLSSLHLYDNRIASIENLSRLPVLHTLLLSGNLIDSVGALSSLNTLRILELGNNQIHSLDGLGPLSHLERLNLSENQICDLRVLRRFKNLTRLDLSSNLLTDLSDLSELSNVHTLGLSRNMIRDPSPVLRLSRMRHLTLSYNFIPVEQDFFKDMFREAEARGIYLNLRGQAEFRSAPQSLVRSLIGHPFSNQKLGAHLRQNGYLRLIDLILDSSLNQDNVDHLCKVWEDALKFDKPISTLPFPGK